MKIEREVIPTGWDGHFRRFYINFWLWLVCYLVCAPLVLPVILFVNFFGCEDLMLKDAEVKKYRGFESRPSHQYYDHAKDSRSNTISHPSHQYGGHGKDVHHNVILAVLWYKNQRLNVDESSDLRQSFPKRSLNLGGRASSQLMTIYHRLTAVIMRMLECTSQRGVDIF